MKHFVLFPRDNPSKRGMGQLVSNCSKTKESDRNIIFIKTISGCFIIIRQQLYIRQQLPVMRPKFAKTVLYQKQRFNVF